MRSLKEALVHKHLDNSISHIKELDMKFDNIYPGVLIKLNSSYYGSPYCLVMDQKQANKISSYPILRDTIVYYYETINDLDYLELGGYQDNFPNYYGDPARTIIKMWELDRVTLSKLKDKDSILKFLKLSYDNHIKFEKELGIL